MKIAFNPSTVAALTTPPNNKDITFDLRGRNIFARGVKFCGTDTWRDIKINNVSIGSNILDLRNGSNTTLTNTNGVVTINSTWRPVVDNLTSDSTTSSLSAKQGKVLKSLIDGKSDSGHTHDDRYLRLTGGWMSGDINFGGDNKIYWGRNTDSASISFKNDGDGDADSYMSFVTSDNGNEYFRWSHSSGSTNTEWMALRSDGLRVGGTKVSLEGHSHNDLYYTKTEVNNKLNGKSNSDHNHDSRYVKKSGDTMLGALNFANGTWNKIGDDVYMGDHNIGGQLCIMGANGTTGLSFHKYGDASIRKSITFDGNTLYMNGSCDYATLSNQTNLLAINTVPNKTTVTSIGSWSPISGRYVFHQKWTDTSTGGNSADFGIYLDGNLTANMVLDGYYNSLLGFRVIGATGGFLKANGTIDYNTYLTSHQSLSNYYTKSEVDTKLNSKLNYRLFWERTNIDLNSITEAWHTYEVNNGTGTANTPTNAPWHQAVQWGTGDTNYAVQLCTAYTSNYSLYLRHKIAGKWYNWIQLATTTDIPSSLKNPYALTISLNGTSQGPYDGSAAKNINITPSSIGAATSDHNHDGRYIRYYAVTTLDCNNLAVGLTAAGVSATNAAHTNYSAFLYISDVGTPFQIQIPDSSVPYIYKRYYSSGTWSEWFKLNAGYADSAGSTSNLTVHQYLSNTDTTWWPLIWGGSSHNNTSDSTGTVYKSYNKLSWQTSSQTLYATHLRTTDLNTQTALFHPDDDSTLKIYSGKTQEAVSDGHIGLQTSIDGTDGQTHAYPTQYGSRCVLALQPRGGSVYIGNMPNGGNGRKLNVNGDIGLFNAGSIRDLTIGGGIYWNPYVESTTDSSDAASITLVKSGVAGGTTLVLSQMNDANDTIQFQTNGAAKLYHNSYPILTSQNTFVNNNKGYIYGNEITQVNNADTVDGYHANGGSSNPYGRIPVIESDGVMEVGKYIDFHNDNSGEYDFSTRLLTTGNYVNYVNLPSESGTLALTKDVLTFSNNIADYLDASFNNSDFSKKAASKYIQCYDSAGGWWNWMAGKFMKAGSSDAYVLLGGGSHKLESSLRVAYASNADMVDGYHIDDILPYGLENLCIGAVASGGQTILNSDGSITTSGNNSDTYFFVRSTENLIAGQIYTVGFYVTGVSSGNTATWSFGFAAQDNNKLVINIKNNGWCWGTGTIPGDIVAGENIILDDRERSFYSSINISKFVIVKGKQKAYYTPPISKMSVNYASSAGSATKVIVNQHTTDDTNYPLVWSNQNNTNTVTENQLFKSWSDLYYNPKNKRLYANNLLTGVLQTTDNHYYRFNSDATLRIYGSPKGSTERIYFQAGIDDRIDDYDIPSYGGEQRHSIILNPRGGFVGIGDTNPSYKLSVGGTLRVTSTSSFGGTMYLPSTGVSYIANGGRDTSGADFNNANIVIRSWWGISFKSYDDIVRTYIDTRTGNIGTKGNIYATHFYESSDKTLKKNIKSILSSTNIPKIREFDWKDTEEHSYGFIAQELEEQGYGCLVSEVNGKKTVNYTATLALTVAKLQNLINIQNKKISNLTKELKALKYGRKKNS